MYAESAEDHKGLWGFNMELIDKLLRSARFNGGGGGGGTYGSHVEEAYGKYWANAGAHKFVMNTYAEVVHMYRGCFVILINLKVCLLYNSK